MDISIIIPVLNEKDNIIPIYKSLDSVLKKIRVIDYEIVFIDDGSTDGTLEKIKKIINARVKAIIFRRNFGKSAALKAGFEFSSGKIIITMDGDLQDDPKEIPRFLAKLKEDNDLVSGWKKERKDPLGKRFASRLFNKVVATSSGLKIHDFNCGFKAYKKEVVGELDLYGELYRFIPALVHQKGFKVAEIVVHHNQRIHGRSKYTASRWFRGLYDFWTISFLRRFSFQPMYFFGSLGFLLFVIGLIINIYLSIEKIFFHRGLSDRPLLLLGILLIILGVQFIAIGLLGELQVFLSKKKDTYSIKEILSGRDKHE
jgi:glycosyltransferase involved in cell wall biosynthesis